MAVVAVRSVPTEEEMKKVWWELERELGRYRWLICRRYERLSSVLAKKKAGTLFHRASFAPDLDGLDSDSSSPPSNDEGDGDDSGAKNNSESKFSSISTPEDLAAFDARILERVRLCGGTPKHGLWKALQKEWGVRAQHISKRYEQLCFAAERGEAAPTIEADSTQSLRSLVLRGPMRRQNAFNISSHRYTEANDLLIVRTVLEWGCESNAVWETLRAQLHNRKSEASLRNRYDVLRRGAQQPRLFRADAYTADEDKIICAAAAHFGAEDFNRVQSWCSVLGAQLGRSFESVRTRWLDVLQFSVHNSDMVLGGSGGSDGGVNGDVNTDGGSDGAADLAAMGKQLDRRRYIVSRRRVGSSSSGGGGGGESFVFSDPQTNSYLSAGTISENNPASSTASSISSVATDAPVHTAPARYQHAAATQHRLHQVTDADTSDSEMEDEEGSGRDGRGRLAAVGQVIRNSVHAPSEPPTTTITAPGTVLLPAAVALSPSPPSAATGARKRRRTADAEKDTNVNAVTTAAATAAIEESANISSDKITNKRGPFSGVEDAAIRNRMQSITAVSSTAATEGTNSTPDASILTALAGELRRSVASVHERWLRLQQHSRQG